MADQVEAASPVVQFKGEEFRATFPVPPMALMEFAHVAQDGTESGELEGLAAMYDLLESVIDPEDWLRFRKHAKKSRATDADLMLLTRRIIRGEVDRPTERPSDSSDGPSRTEPNSEGDSSSLEPALRVVKREEASGRPDRALMVLMAHEARAATAA